MPQLLRDLEEIAWVELATLNPIFALSRWFHRFNSGLPEVRHEGVDVSRVCSGILFHHEMLVK